MKFDGAAREGAGMPEQAAGGVRLSDNRQFRMERQDDRWQLLLGPLKDIGLFVEAVLQRGHSGTPVRMLFVRYAVSTKRHASPTFTATVMYLPPRMSG